MIRETLVYDFDLNFTLHSRQNKFRVCQKNINGKKICTTSVYYDYDKIDPVITVSNSDCKVIFKQPSLYELYDIYGNILIKGYDKEINFSKLKYGTYYLNIDNQTLKITKKENGILKCPKKLF